MNQLSDAQLNSLNKDALVILVSSMQSQIQSLKDQLDYANAQLADTSKPKQDAKFKKKKKKDEESLYKVSNKELEKALKDKLAANKAAAKPIYTEEELAEIEAQQEAEEEREYDIDYDEYEDFYDEDDN